MKPSRLIFLALPLLFVVIMACKTENDVAIEQGGSDLTVNTDSASNRLIVRIGSRTFTATLLNSPTVAAFKARLPLTLPMQELNGNEKFAQLPVRLPTNAANPGSIQAGDLMLYGSNTLVVFYETFRTSYPYTRLGRINHPSGLATALGSENVTVTFELEP